MSLEDYGWNDELAESMPPGLEPGRVVMALGESLRLRTRDGECLARVAGRLKHEAADQTALPAIGDWVGVRGERIERVLPRRTRLSRKAAGRRTDEQIVAANVDKVVIVMGLDGDYSARRLERYLTTVWESGASPVVLLNKADVATDLAAQRDELDRLAIGTPVVVSSCLERTGLDEVESHLAPRETAVLVGSSGVGKSTLINLLLGDEVQETKTVRASDETGRHTTTSRELFVLPSGALLIDNPGIRELSLWASEGSLDQSFDDILTLAADCRYRDCAHADEPGCAVTEAARSGVLPAERLDSYRSLRKELQYLHVRQDQSAQLVQKQKWRAIHKEMRKSGRHRRT